MQGRLYRVRWYPGMRPAAELDDWVTGELYRLRQPPRTLAILDDYEGRHDYLRVLQSAQLPGGGELRCWVYLFRRPVPEYRRIASGEWVKTA